MIPIGESVGSQRRPVVTIGLIAACVLVFLYELTLRGAALDTFVAQWGVVPRDLLAALRGAPGGLARELPTLLTSQFLHAGFFHLGGNMLFLWVFGRAIEDRLGPALYLVFYLVAGAVAGLVQTIIAGPADTVPMVGASGSIAAVLGAYFVAHPTAWVTILLPVLFFFWAFDLPAILVLAFWFVSQFFNGVASITQASQATAGVAVWAHVAGFAVGAAGGLVLPSRPPVRRPTAGPAHRPDVPGPARLVSSVADLLALLLAARLLLRFFGQTTPRSPLAGIAEPILNATSILVRPLAELVPTVSFLGAPVELASLVAIALVYVLAGLVRQVFLNR